MCAATVSAQTTRVADKELIGVWFMEWMQYDGEKKQMCGATMGYASFKYYGADGEYACAEIALTNAGAIVVYPHEHGTYSFKNGVYSEMGRPAVPSTDMVLIDKTHFQGRWKNRTESWVKQTTLPDVVVKYLLDRCRLMNTPTDVQNIIKQRFFQKKQQ